MKKSLLLLWLTVQVFMAGAQTVAVPTATTVAAVPAWQTKFFEMPDLALPMLIESAVRHSAELQGVKADKAIGQEDMRIARKAILAGVQLSGGYGYGNVANMTIADPNIPTAYTTTASNRYAAALNLNLPLDRVLSRRNQLSRQQLQCQKLEYQEQARINDLRLKLIEMYQAVLLAHKVVELRQQAYLSAQMNYQLGEKQFRSGDLVLADMLRINDLYAGAVVDRETANSNYTTAFMLLEDVVGERIAELMSRK